MKNIALFTTWNTTCGVAQFSEFLVEAIEKQGVNVTVFSAYHSDRLRKNLPNHPHCYHEVFHSGFSNPDDYQKVDGPKLVDTWNKNKPDAVLIQYQDYLWPNKVFLADILHYCRIMDIPCYIILHDTCLSPLMHCQAAAGIIKPPAMANFRVSNNDFVIDQGIPEFDFQDKPELANNYYKIACFGYGRNRIDDIARVVDSINDTGVLPKPIVIHIRTAKPELLQEYNQIQAKHTCIVLEDCLFLPASELAKWLYNSHASIIWYPEIPGGQSTSSAFRFCMGAKVPLICNVSNWVTDKINSGGWIQFTDELSLRSQLMGLLYSYSARSWIMKDQELEIKKAGWSKIASEYLSLTFPAK